MNTLDIPQDLSLSQSFLVKQEHSAAHLGSGTISVLSTPSMILFMEIVARNALQNVLPEGYSSVGIEVNIKHLKAVKIGAEVRSQVEMLKHDRKKITFSVKVFHGDDLLGSGEHTRFIIEEASFLESIN